MKARIYHGLTQMKFFSDSFLTRFLISRCFLRKKLPGTKFSVVSHERLPQRTFPNERSALFLGRRECHFSLDTMDPKIPNYKEIKGQNLCIQNQHSTENQNAQFISHLFLTESSDDYTSKKDWRKKHNTEMSHPD